jgi:hypothetical protein
MKPDKSHKILIIMIKMHNPQYQNYVDNWDGRPYKTPDSTIYFSVNCG